MVKPNRLPSAKRRRLVVEALVELAGGQDPRQITTAAIAERLDLTQGTLFHHFGSKQAIWEAALDWMAVRLLRRVDAAAAAAGSPLAGLRATFRAHAEFLAEHPGAPRILFAELQCAEASPLRGLAQVLMRRYAERVALLLEAGKAQGQLPITLEVEPAALLFLGALQGLLVQAAIADDPQAIRRDAPKVFAAYCRGLHGQA